jgi:hypothetical protein
MPLAHDVFISYSHIDKSAADAACATLEAAGIRCWIAPRDISPGAEWGEAIIDAINSARVMVLIFSSNTNESRQVRREVERAVGDGVTIMPIRIEQAAPTRSLAYFMAGVHWLDALTPPLEQHLQRLAVSIKALLKTDLAHPANGAGETAFGHTVNEPSDRTTPERRREQQRREAEPPAPRSRKPMIVALAVLVVFGAAAVAVIQTGKWTIGSQREAGSPSVSTSAAMPAPTPTPPASALATTPAPPAPTPEPAATSAPAPAPVPATTTAPPAPASAGTPTPTPAPVPAAQSEPSAPVASVAPTTEPGSSTVAMLPPKPAAPVVSSPYDGMWLGFRRCPEWHGRQAFQHPVTMTIQNNKATSLTGFPVDSPGYLTYQGTVEQNGKLLLRGYGISGGLPGGRPRGERYPFLYEGIVSGDRYNAKDMSIPRPCTMEMTHQH